MKLKILRADQAQAMLDRRSDRLAEAIEVVKPILDAVQSRGDAALYEFAKKFDSFEGTSLLANRSELEQASRNIAPALRAALMQCKQNVEAFAKLQKPPEFLTELSEGHQVGQVVRPLETVACYVPGGRYPLPSTVLMTVVPALVAGVPNIWVTTPKANEVTYASALIAGTEKVARLGGAQAIAAFAFGTDTIPKADRIVGPGNIYVTAAKKLLAGEVGIDFLAGPTEVLIIADEGNPEWIAADLLAQAEHDTDASALLVTTNPELAQQVAEAVERQLTTLPTAAIATQSIEACSAVILTDSVEESIAIANQIAAEHLCLHDPALLGKIQHAGSIFLGPNSPEAVGDYATGPSHVLPTGGVARLRGGLSVMDFLKVITVQQLSASALGRIAASAAAVARAEGLEAHARSIEVRDRA